MNKPCLKHKEKNKKHQHKKYDDLIDEEDDHHHSHSEDDSNNEQQDGPKKKEIKEAHKSVCDHKERKEIKQIIQKNKTQIL